MTWDPDMGGDFQSCRGAWVTCWLAPGSSPAAVSRPCATLLKDRMDTHMAPRGFLMGSSLLRTKEAHMKALEEKNDHSHVSWRRARGPVRGCTSAALSVPPGCGLGLCVGNLGCPRRALQGWSRKASVLLSGHLPRTDVPEAESRDPAREQQNHSPGHGCDRPGREALLQAIAWPCHAALALMRRSGEGCPRAGQCRAGSRDGFSPCSTTPSPSVHLENDPAEAAAACASPRGICLPLAHGAGHGSASPAWSSCSPSPAPPQP